MIIIYHPKDIIEAQLIADQLKAGGINSHIGGQYLQGGIGELATMDFLTLQVEEEDRGPAMTVLKKYQSAQKQHINFSNNPETSEHATGKRNAFYVAIMVIMSVSIILALAYIYS
jgi:hypothetical protein